MSAAAAPRPASPATPRYRARQPEKTPLYGGVLDHYERFESVYEERFAERYGPCRSAVGDSFLRYLDCGIQANGFLAVRCEKCGHEVQVPWT